MPSAARTLLSAAALAALAACTADNSTPPTAPRASAGPSRGVGTTMRYLHAKVCPAAPFGEARCHAWVRVDANGRPQPNPTPSGYLPADLQSAYGLAAASASSGEGVTIAIVDAYDDGNAESDLAVYRSQFGLPACTTANGCFRKINQNGGTRYPRGDRGWAAEISLDLDMASAICPKCKLLLVEAKTSSLANLAAAVDQAAAQGANVISNSYGGREYSSETNDEAHFNHPGIMITVSSGDGGYGVEFPAASQYVTAVGGTSLRRDASAARGWAETVWAGAGSGCSAYITKPSWQIDADCPRRTVADVAAIADPSTGVAVYDTYRLHPGGWLVFGGTSVSSPLIAGVYALAGNGGSLTYESFSYSQLASLWDVVGGNNGRCGGYLCTGVPGYDGPTGNGTPKGTGAF